MQDDVLSDFLKSKNTGSVESQGEFTLSASRALEKLAEYQLPEPGLWIVKLVQAGIMGGSQKIHVKILKSAVSIDFEGGEELYAPEIYSKVVSGEIPQDSKERHLVTGIRAALSGSDSIEWFAHGGQGVLLESGSATNLQATLPDGIRFRFLRKKSDNSLMSFARRADEYLALAERCAYSPSEIWADGRLVSGRAVYPIPPKTKAKPWVTFLVPTDQKMTPLRTGFSRSRAAGEILVKPKLPKSPSFCPLDLNMLLSLQVGKNARSVIMWVKDGVVLKTSSLEFPHRSFKLVVVASADNCEVDLSEFAFRGKPPDIVPHILTALDTLTGQLWANPSLVAKAEPKKLLNSLELRQARDAFTKAAMANGRGFGGTTAGLNLIATVGELGIQAAVNVFGDPKGEEAMNALGSAVDKFRSRYYRSFR